MTKITFDSVDVKLSDAYGQEQKIAESIMGSSVKDISDRWTRRIAEDNTRSLANTYQQCLDIKRCYEELHGCGAELLRVRHGLHKNTIRDYVSVAYFIDRRTFEAIEAYNVTALEQSRSLFTPQHMVRLAKIRELAERDRPRARRKRTCQ